MYNVTDLTLEIPNFKGNQRALATDTGFGKGEQGDFGENFFEKPDDEEEERAITGEELIEFIRRVIAPGTWPDDGEEFRGFIGDFDHRDRSERHRDDRLDGESLVDIIGITIGGQTWLATRTRE
jgi:hypothetical protein